MTPRPTRKLASALMSKGFACREGDHKYYYLYVDGRRTIVRTKLSHGKREYDNNLLTQMRHQLRLRDSRQFENLIDCPMSHAEYVAYLVNVGVVDTTPRGRQ